MTKIAMAQMGDAGSFAKNFAKSLDAVKYAAEGGAKLVLFPEMHLTAFFPQFRGLDVTEYAVDFTSPIVQAFQNACRYHHIAAVPNFYLLEHRAYYDASIYIDENGRISFIQKMVHVANAEHFYEADYYRQSNAGFQVGETSLGRIGIIVCFDRHFPESIRTEVLKGADLILIPAVNTKTEPLEMFQKEIEVQAYQNSVAILMCNRVGKEEEMEFAGESLYVDAHGTTQYKAGDQTELIFVDVDMEEPARVRASLPYLDHRRRSFYL